eukprot:TRINITY_DN11284_c0_g1_i1.p1 TRINITY_DN11284_c0_g1~~TRINITY_DN11284_c0_g1_i1.p1  ORF type:complete len:334 (-),score=32.20 TRINITY_DN11284_c0_g1_i1:59-1060(-)
MNQLTIVVLMILSVLGHGISAKSCIEDPTQASCVNFNMDETQVNHHITSLCNKMYMPGCSIETVCKDNTYESSKYCKPFSIYKNLCLDMPGMRNCTAYVSMCNNNKTVVKECKTEVVPLPSSKQLAGDISGICGSMDMDGCDKCSKSGYNCDGGGVEIYSMLCTAMPNMDECKDWKSMCAAAKLPFCDLKVPQMIMYFHDGIMDYILFKFWVPENNLGYAMSMLIVIAFSILHEYIKYFRKKVIDRIDTTVLHQDHHGMVQEKTPLLLGGGNSVRSKLLKSFLHSIEVTWSLLCMLIAMTYNVGLFGALIFGYFIGHFLFGCEVKYEPSSSCH